MAWGGTDLGTGGSARQGKDFALGKTPLQTEKRRCGFVRAAFPGRIWGKNEDFLGLLSPVPVARAGCAAVPTVCPESLPAPSLHQFLQFLQFLRLGRARLELLPSPRG